MAIAYAAGGGFTVAAASTTNHTIPGTPATNDIVLCASASDGSDIVDAHTTTMTGVIQSISGVSVDHVIEYVRQPGTPITVIPVDSTVATGSKIMPTVIQVFTGIDTTTAVDATPTTATGSTGLPNPPTSNATTLDGAMMMCSGALDDDIDVVFTAGTGYTTDFDQQDATGATSTNGATVGVGHKLIPSASSTDDPGAYTASGESDAWSAVTWPWRPAAGGGAARPQGPLGHPFHGPFGGPI